jgi:cell division protein FtsL
MTTFRAWGGPRSRVRNLRLVREPDRLQTRRLLLTLICALAIIVPLMANVWGHAEGVRLGYRLEATRAARSALLEKNRRLRLERAARADLSDAQRRATEELGILQRLPSATIVVSEVGQPRTPDPATTTSHEIVVTARRAP